MSRTAQHHLPHMSAPDLERFLAENASELGITPADATCFRIRRRRRSLEMRSADSLRRAASATAQQASSSDAAAASSLALLGGVAPFRHVKVAVMGDESAWKLNLVRSFYDTPNPALSKSSQPSTQNPRSVGGASAGRKLSDGTPLEIQSRTLFVSSEQQQQESQGSSSQSAGGPSQFQVETWPLPATSIAEALRQECLHGAHAVVIVFSVKNRASFEAVRSHWAKEVQSFLEASTSSHIKAPFELPIVLVGAEAEARTDSKLAPSLTAQVIPAVEAVQLAQDIGASKYVEIFSDNAHHAHEVFAQACRAAFTARVASGVSDAYLRQLHSIHQQVADDLFRCAPPRCLFNTVERTATVVRDDVDAIYYVTFDGSDPATSSTAVVAQGPFELVKPMPKAVRVIARGRCRYPSQTVSIPLPKETAAPSAYFDVFTRTLHVSVDPSTDLATTGSAIAPPTGAVGTGDAADAVNASSNASPQRGGHRHPVALLRPLTHIRYTIDGTDPTPQSLVYTGPVRFSPYAAADGGVNASTMYGAFHDANGSADDSGVYGGSTTTVMVGLAVPRVIKLFAVSEDHFRSRVVTVDVPAPLDPPKIHYSRQDGTLTIEVQGASAAAIDVRYTIDGTTPTWQSTRYSRPVMLPRDEVRVIRAVAFPRIALPSAEAEFVLPATVHRADPTLNTIGTNKSTMARVVQSQSIRKENEAAKTPLKVAPGSRAASPVVGSVRVPPSRQQQPLQQSPPPPQRSADSPKRKAVPTSAAAFAQQQQRSRTPTAKTTTTTTPRKQLDATTTGGATSSKRPGVTCAADAHAVTFAFDDPICLSHVTVATPGGGCGPSTYEVHVYHTGLQRGEDPVLVGAGVLDDFHGIQTLHVNAGARLLPVTRVDCRFSGGAAEDATIGSADDPNGSTTPLFQINDLKIHGKPFLAK